MAEKQISSIDRTLPPNSDWPTLIERAVDDVARILRSEAQILQTSIGAAIQRQISSAVALLVVVGIVIVGALCLVFAAIFLLHQWLPLWQSFGIVGLVMLLIGTICKATLGPHPRTLSAE
jgi:VIT1/CCC1 family predicted Fe2+/Mn2+ transporter